MGDYVKVDEAIASIETGKAAVDIKSPVNGKIVKFLAEVGATVLVGNDFAIVDEKAEAPGEGQAAPQPEEPKAEKKKVEKKEPKPAKKAPEAAEPAKPKPAPKPAAKPKTETPSTTGARNTRRVPMGKLREHAASRLKESQNVNAMLTTFNECDMSAITSLRKDLGTDFSKRYGVDLTFMSAFVKAATMSLMKYPAINGLIDGREIVYHDYVDMAVEVADSKGVIVPVLRNCESLSFGDIEKVKGGINCRVWQI